jgi:hypothetical protein
LLGVEIDTLKMMKPPEMMSLALTTHPSQRKTPKLPSPSLRRTPACLQLSPSREVTRTKFESLETTLEKKMSGSARVLIRLVQERGVSAKAGFRGIHKSDNQNPHTVDIRKLEH